MRYYPLRYLVAGITLLGLLFFVSHIYISPTVFVHLPSHSAIEALGALAALILSFLIIHSFNRQRLEGYSLWVPCGLIGMGVLDLFHSFSSPGESFVWLHSTATLVGGVLFALVCLPNRFSEPKLLAALPFVVLVVSFVFGLYFMFNPQHIPPMIGPEGFTGTARALNLIGGGLFIVAAAWFFGRYRRDKAFETALFASLCLLFGIAGILFDFSHLWDTDWWLWHIIRLLAYLIALIYVFILYMEAEEGLQQAHDELEQRVVERTAELQLTHDQLLHAEKLSAVGKLSASIAHEINNPLFGIRNVLAGIGKRASLAKEDADLVTMALGECDRIKYLIRDLRDFNRPTSGEKVLMDLHQALDGILLLLKKEFKSKNITLEKHYAAETPLIHAVGDQIKQVLLNILNNAGDALGEAGGTITVGTEVLDREVAFYVKDTGVGIKSEDMDHIFEPFFTTKPEVKGTGLGLSVSYGIVKRHGGRIGVRSEVGRGSTFTVFLPKAGKGAKTRQ